MKDLLKEFEEQNNDVLFSLTDKIIAIGGLSGCGKTAIMHELSNIISKESGNNNIIRILPLEKRYNKYKGFRKYIAEELNYFDGKDELIFPTIKDTAILEDLSKTLKSVVAMLNDQYLLEFNKIIKYQSDIDIDNWIKSGLDKINSDILKINAMKIQKRKLIRNKKPTHYKNFLHLIDGINELVIAKLRNPDFPVSIVGIDPMTILEQYAMDYILWDLKDRTGVVETENSFGAYGAIYKEARNKIKEMVLKPLTSVGLIPWFTFHIKVKGFKDKVNNQEYDTYFPENSASLWNELIKMVDYSILFEDTTFVNNGKLEDTNCSRIIRWRNGNNYTGGKATASLNEIPETQNIYGLTDEQVGRLIYDTILKSLKGNHTDSEFNEISKIQEQNIKEENKNSINTMNELNKISENKEEIENKRDNIKNALINVLKVTLSQNVDAKTQIENFIMSRSRGLSIEEWTKTGDSSEINNTVTEINNALGGITGYVKIETI
jgi:energy-coupling factor transporter ATP-binding protein EcfA2